jgi:hypothetical protein
MIYSDCWVSRLHQVSAGSEMKNVCDPRLRRIRIVTSLGLQKWGTYYMDLYGPICCSIRIYIYIYWSIWTYMDLYADLNQFNSTIFSTFADFAFRISVGLLGSVQQISTHQVFHKALDVMLPASVNRFIDHQIKGQWSMNQWVMINDHNRQINWWWSMD